MDKAAEQSLREKQTAFTLRTDEYRTGLAGLANDIASASKDAKNEASVVSIFELELFAFMKAILALTFYPKREVLVDTIRHTAKGRIDSKIGAVVIEFKHHTKFRTVKQRKKATDQLCEYLEGLYAAHEAHYVGFVTDGVRGKIVRRSSEGLSNEGFAELNAGHLDSIIRGVVVLDKKGLTPENLVADFCEPAGTSVAVRLTRVLFTALRRYASGRSKMLYAEWRELFRLAHDDKSKQRAIEERRAALQEVIGTRLKSVDSEYEALYAVQTAFAIIVKIIAFKVISKVRFSRNLMDLHSLAEAASDALRSQMYQLEEGAIFRSLGIGNLLEGDFFAWYSMEGQWSEEIAGLVREVFGVLAKYEDKGVFDEGDTVQDLFKDLFQGIMPAKVRHSMGEFYTPPWLADNIVQTALKGRKKRGWRGLDPCAGSGTFLTALIRRVLAETEALPNRERVEAVLGRVVGIDLNPLAVLMARINYFVNIAGLISEEDEFEIPVYLGDSSYVPERKEIGGVDCAEYTLNTMRGPIAVTVPCSAVSDAGLFSRTMTQLEQHIRNEDVPSIVNALIGVVAEPDATPEVRASLEVLAEKFVELEKEDWNGIWARIVTNFLTTAHLGRFDLIVGNPPWIDWKNLPAGYRERIKGLCIERHLFSGDSITGGINLNVCALIANVSAQNWLSDTGTLAFLMPQSVLFQRSYEGFRNFRLDDGRLYFHRVEDWSRAGHPFQPVQHKFVALFFRKRRKSYSCGIPLVHRVKKKGTTALSKVATEAEFRSVKHLFRSDMGIVGQANPKSTIFSYAEDKDQLAKFKLIAGECEYIGREGIEFYPQELFLLEIDDSMPRNSKVVFVRNYQNDRSKYRIPADTVPLERLYLRPMVKGPCIERFHLGELEYVVPFPYVRSNKRSPVPIATLTRESPQLASYLNRFRRVIEAQTDYNERIIGEKHNSEFYALARVGKYSFAKYHVAFRDNTKWMACVTGPMPTVWGGQRCPVFQNHAVSICERSDGKMIGQGEAHYLCAVLNAPIVGSFLLNSSDSRSFKIRPPICVPLYDKTDARHVELVRLSREAHRKHANARRMEAIDLRLDELYLDICKATKAK